MQSVKKICQEMLKIESGNELVTDRQMDVHSTQIFERTVLTYYPHFVSGGVLK